MRKLRFFHPSLPWQLVALGALLFSLIWGTVFWELQRLRQDRLASFRSDLTHLAEVLDETLVRQLQSIDNALLIMRGEYVDNKPNLPRMAALLHQGTLRDVDIHVTVIGQDGFSEYSDVPGASGRVYLGDRAHFRIFAEGGQDQLYISEPVFGRITKRWGMQLARPILAHNGKFLGVVVVFLPPEQLTYFMQPLAIGNDTIMSVLSTAGGLLSRSRDFDKYRDIRLNAEQMADYQRKRSGFALRRSVMDQVERGLAHRWLKGYPLLLVVSRTSDALDAEVGVTRQRLLILAGAASLAVLGVLFLLGRALRQREAIASQLNKEHRHLLAAQRIAQLGSWELDWRSGQLFWSEEISRIFDLQPSQCPQTMEAYLQLVHPDDRDAVRQTFSSSLINTEPGHVMHRLCMANGQIKWISGQWLTEFDSKGQATRSYGTLLDITERKHEETERDMLTRERLLLLESTGEGIYGIDNSGNCTFINQSGARMLGYESSELIGKNIHEWIHHKHADGTPYPEADCPVVQTAISGESCKIEDEVFWRKDGQPVPVAYAGQPIREGDRITGTVVTFSDIGARKHAEVELRIAEKAFQTQEGMFVTDENGTILRVNDAFTEITGYTASEIVGQNPRFRSSGRQDAIFYAAMWARIKSTGTWKGEIWNRRKNGEIYPESVTITAVKGDDTAVTHYVATMHDISERKTAEEAIHQLAYYDSLTQLPNRRLLHDRLHQARLSSARHKHHGALMFLDLDKFKALNDTLGHDIGDLLLQQVAQRLQSCVREADTVARLGGDEFVLLLEDLSEQVTEAIRQAENIGQKILDRLNQPYDLAGKVHHSTPSIGGTLFCGQALTEEALLKQADLAMYQSKAAGRNTLRFFDPTMLDHASE